MTRAEILREAAVCVCGQREQDYGSPEDNFAVIAELWNGYLGLDKSGSGISSMDVAMMMALLKIARIRGGRATEDSFIDLAGYAACGGEIAADRPIKTKEDKAANCEQSEKKTPSLEKVFPVSETAMWA